MQALYYGLRTFLLGLREVAQKAVTQARTAGAAGTPASQPGAASQKPPAAPAPGSQAAPAGAAQPLGSCLVACSIAVMHVSLQLLGWRCRWARL